MSFPTKLWPEEFVIEVPRSHAATIDNILAARDVLIVGETLGFVFCGVMSDEATTYLIFKMPRGWRKG